MERMDRRRFLRAGGALTASAVGLGALGSAAWGQEPRKSRVAAIRSDAVQPMAGRLNPKILADMLDAAVQHATGGQGIGAWASLFAKDDVVAIKVNCSGGPLLSSNPALVEAIVKRLQDVGVSADNVAIYDRADGALAACGFQLNTGAGVKCGGVEGHWDQARPIRQGAFRGLLPVILNYVSAIINVPILKDAGGAGVTISMKNHFGTISNPQDCHGGGCDPYIADVNCIPDLKSKQRLIVCDATSACYEGGPAADPRFMWRPNTILAATDPVALDTVGAAMIDAKRQQQGLRTLEAAGRKPKQLASASARGLGTSDLTQIDLLEKTL